MQARDRRHEGQPKAAAGTRPALFKPHKTIEHALTILAGNAGANVGNRDLHGGICINGGDFDLAASIGSTIFYRVIDPLTNVIDVHISRLRAKIDKEFDTPLLHTVRGVGYSIRVERA